MTKTVPGVIGRYEIQRAIGAGGMGTLYLARDPVIDRLVAIKLLREGLDSPEIRERFAREARSAGRLHHTNIVTIFDVGEHAGEPFIAMQYIQGETLADLIRRQAATSLILKVEWMIDLCAGLHYAHCAGVIHRDIKPANVMIGQDGVLKILDFGIARLGPSGMTHGPIGTLNYMAPEQMEGKPLDARADIFSLGALFYELLAYRRAFPGDVSDGVITKILLGEPQPLDEVIGGVDSQLVEIVNRCLRKTPESRYPDCASLAREVASVRLRLGQGDARSLGTVGPDADTDVVPYQAEKTPTPKRARQRVELLRIRSEEIRAHLVQARAAMEQADYEDAVRECDRALVLDPEHAEALALADGARSALEQEQIAQWVAQGHDELERGALTAASLLVERALSLNSDSPEAMALRQAVDEARRQLAEAAERTRQLEEALAAAEREFNAGALDGAAAAVADALAIDPSDERALALQSRVVEAIEAKRRAEEDARATAAIDEAHRLFAAGEQTVAIQRLKDFQPDHARVTQSVAELQLEAREIERRRSETERLEAERRRREEEERRRVEAERVRHEIAGMLIESGAYYEHRDYSAALARARDALALDPRHADAAALVTQAEAAVARRQEAVDLVRGARQLIERGRFDEALETIRAVTDVDATIDGLVALQTAAEAGRAADMRRRRVNEQIKDASPARATGDLITALRRTNAALEADPTDPRAAALMCDIDESIAETARPDEGVAKDLHVSPMATTLVKLDPAQQIPTGQPFIIRHQTVQPTRRQPGRPAAANQEHVLRRWQLIAVAAGILAAIGGPLALWRAFQSKPIDVAPSTPFISSQLAPPAESKSTPSELPGALGNPASTVAGIPAPNGPTARSTSVPSGMANTGPQAGHSMQPPTTNTPESMVVVTETLPTDTVQPPSRLPPTGSSSTDGSERVVVPVEPSVSAGSIPAFGFLPTENAPAAPRVSPNGPSRSEKLTISRVSHLAGIPGLSRNSSGDLILTGQELIFQQKQNVPLTVRFSSVQLIEVASADREYGAAAMAGALATPFGLGGWLMAAKHKVDLLICNYRNEAGGLMGVVLELPKGGAKRTLDWLAPLGVPVKEPAGAPAGAPVKR